MSDIELYAPIWAICDELATAAMEKGLRNPSVDITCKSGERLSVWLNSPSLKTPLRNYDWVSFKNVEEARKFISDIPDQATMAMRNHMARIAGCIDKGREDGIDDAYITPLAAVKQDMSDNLLAAPVKS